MARCGRRRRSATQKARWRFTFCTSSVALLQRVRLLRQSRADRLFRPRRNLPTDAGSEERSTVSPCRRPLDFAHKPSNTETIAVLVPFFPHLGRYRSAACCYSRRRRRDHHRCNPHQCPVRHDSYPVAENRAFAGSGNQRRRGITSNHGILPCRFSPPKRPFFRKICSISVW